MRYIHHFIRSKPSIKLDLRTILQYSSHKRSFIWFDREFPYELQIITNNNKNPYQLKYKKIEDLNSELRLFERRINEISNEIIKTNM